MNTNHIIRVQLLREYCELTAVAYVGFEEPITAEMFETFQEQFRRLAKEHPEDTVEDIIFDVLHEVSFKGKLVDPPYAYIASYVEGGPCDG